MKPDQRPRKLNNVVGAELHPDDLRERLIAALRPYMDYPEVRQEVRELKAPRRD